MPDTQLLTCVLAQVRENNAICTEIYHFFEIFFEIQKSAAKIQKVFDMQKEMKKIFSFFVQISVIRG
jgi:hypothetical protein